MADQRLQQRQILLSHPLRTIPVAAKPHGTIPNTPLAVAAIAFLLGAVCALGSLMFVGGAFASSWWSTYQLGFFVASWAVFHWAEFAVTAGWNLEKCSVDCAFTSIPSPSLKRKFSSVSTRQWRPVSHRKWNCLSRIFIGTVLLAELQIE
jgi:hypothetical protein